MLTGCPAEALDHFRVSHEHARTQPYPLNRASSLWGIGLARHALGEVAAACLAWREAVDIAAGLQLLKPGEEHCLATDGVPEAPWIIRATT